MTGGLQARARPRHGVDLNRRAGEADARQVEKRHGSQAFPSRFSTCGTLRRPCCAPCSKPKARSGASGCTGTIAPPRKLLMQYLDSHMLPGYAALEAGQVTGYAFCVYEETKAVIGDVFALAGRQPDLPDASAGSLADAQPARNRRDAAAAPVRNPAELAPGGPRRVATAAPSLRPHAARLSQGRVRGLSGACSWCSSSTGRWNHAACRSARRAGTAPLARRRSERRGRLIAEAYRGHPDSLINDQYRSVHGSLRFLHNIVRYSGCGAFSPQVSHVVVERSSRELVALVLGSRVSPQSGHITQLCVHPRYRRRGLARLLLSIAGTCFFRQGVSEISLTVTEANTNAIELYRSEGYESIHTFDAAVWERERIR